MATKPVKNKAVKPAEDKAVEPVDPTQPPVDEPQEAAEAARPRFDWLKVNDDSKEAAHGSWRVRLQRSGATGLWRPLVEYVGDDYQTERAAEKALERLLR